jgi:hypothetical protein
MTVSIKGDRVPMQVNAKAPSHIIANLLALRPEKINPENRLDTAAEGGTCTLYIFPTNIFQPYTDCALMYRNISVINK